MDSCNLPIVIGILYYSYYSAVSIVTTNIPYYMNYSDHYYDGNWGCPKSWVHGGTPIAGQFIMENPS